MGENPMAKHSDVPSARISRRTLFKTLGAAAVVGSATTLGVARRAEAAPSPFPKRSAPNPIPFLAGPTGAPDPFNLIHWTLPGPAGATTQILELPAFGLDSDPSTMTDFHGFTAYAVLAGTARSAEGEELECELDVRVMDGLYVGEDGRRHRGTFGFF